MQSTTVFDKPINIDYPDYVVPLRTLKYPSEMYAFCRKNDIAYFGYGFRFVRDSYNTMQLKFGLSSPDPNTKAKPKGERIVRQIGFLPGWPEIVHSSTGSDFWHGCQRLINNGILPEDLTYNDIEVAIWAGNSRNNISILNMDYKDIAAYIESELCDQYHARHGTLPLLNVADPTKNKKFRILTKSTFSILFEKSEVT